VKTAKACNAKMNAVYLLCHESDVISDKQFQTAELWLPAEVQASSWWPALQIWNMGNSHWMN